MISTIKGISNASDNEGVTISFSAECRGDVDALLESINKNYPGKFSETGGGPVFLDVDGKKIPIPNVDVELNIRAPLDIEKLHDLMLELEDSHAMCRSLRQLPLSENSLEQRDFEEAPLDWTDNSEEAPCAPQTKSKSRP